LERLQLGTSTDTLFRNLILPSTKAALDLSKDDPETAVAELEQTREYDHSPFTDISPAYTRGNAFLELKQFGKAEKEFQSMIPADLAGSNTLDVSLSILKLGRTHQLDGHTREAERNFQVLRQRWQDADKDFPPLLELERY
jgi:hypothetical protein